MIDATLIRKHAQRLAESYPGHKGRPGHEGGSSPRLGPRVKGDPDWMHKSAVKVGGIEWQVHPQSTWVHRDFKLSMDAMGKYVLRKNNTKWAAYDSMEAASKTVAFYYRRPNG